MRPRYLIPGTALFCLVLANLCFGQAKSEIKVTVVKGDTLIGICRRHLERPGQWGKIARINRMHNPHLIFPGDIIRIPIEFLRGNKTSATVTFAKGDVTFRTRAAEEWQPVAVGCQIEEGGVIRTGAESSAEIDFPEGPNVLQRASTSVEVVSARSADVFSRYRLSLPVGRAISRIKKATGRETLFQISTPSAICGVRGTAFRSSVDPDGTSRFEVFEDMVEVEARNRTVQIEQGEGTIVRKGETPAPAMALLPYPGLARVEPLYTRLPINLAFEKVAGAVSYRILLARGQEMRDIIAEGLIAPENTFDIAKIEDGTYYLQSTSIGEMGLEGLPSAPVEIRVRTNPAAPFTEVPHDQAAYQQSSLTCKWLKVAEAVRYHVQIAEDKEFSRPVLERDDVTRTEYATGDLDFKSYYFRVSAIAKDGYQGEWSDTLTFTLELPPPVSPPPMEEPQTGAKEITIRWQNLGEGITYRFQMAREASFDKVLVDQKVRSPEITLERPRRAGRYYVRSSAIDRWNQEGDFSSPQSFEIKSSFLPGLLGTAAGLGLIIFLAQ